MVRRIFSGDWFIVFVLSSILIFTAFVPFIFQLLDTPKGTVFLGTHNNALDYPMFIDTILQSGRGRWTVLVKYTTEEQPGTFVYPLYIFVGKIAMVFNINPIAAYHLTRLVVAFIYCFAIYYFISFVFNDRKKRLLAFFLVLFSSGFLTANEPNLPWWTGGDVFRRAVFIPHGILKNVFLLLILVWLGKLFEGKKTKYLIWSCIAGFFLGLLDPMNTMAVLGVFFIWLIFVLSGHTGTGAKTAYIQYFLIYFAFSIAALFYTKTVFEVTPWSMVKAWEAKQQFGVNFWEYANHTGITFYMGILGILWMLKKITFRPYMLFVLTIPMIIFIITNVGKFVGLSGLRFFQIPVYIFLAIGTANIVASRRIPSWLIVIFCGLIILISLPMYRWSLYYQINEFKGYWGNIYVDKNLYDTGLWLKDNVPLDSNVMANYMAGMVLVAISGNNVYIGHPVSTVNFETKKLLTEKFFGGKMSAEEAKKTLKEGRIDYVLGVRGEENIIDSLKYPFLKRIYTGTNTAVYKVDL